MFSVLKLEIRVLRSFTMYKNIMLLISLLFILYGCNLKKEKIQSEEYLITGNGNLLFYNGPSIAKAHGYIFISYINKEGNVILEKYENYKLIKSYIIHDYSNEIYKNRGADDHAAPAIIYDKKQDRLIIATAYHKTKLYIYTYSFDDDSFILNKTIVGMYTYPRIIYSDNTVYIILRRSFSDKSDLVILNSSDNFNREYLIKSVRNKSIIYASKPALYENHLYITYSIHIESKKALRGWSYLKYDLKKNVKIDDYDLKHLLDENYLGNRPTAINVVNDKITIGTTLRLEKYNDDDYYYTLLNKVLIVSINSNTKLEFINHENFVLAPYYMTSITLDNNSNYLYFGVSKVYSNKSISNYCFNENDNYMYPTFYDNDLLYTSSNIDSYQMTWFDNSIYLCKYILNP